MMKNNIRPLTMNKILLFCCLSLILFISGAGTDIFSQQSILNVDESTNPFITYNNFYKIRKNEKWGFCDKEGRIIVKPEYKFAYEFSEGFAGIENSDSMWGFINTSGKIVIECKYDYVKSFKEGYAAVIYKNKWGYIDKKGNATTNFIYKVGYSFSEEVACVVKDNGRPIRYGLTEEDKYGFINTTGKLVIPFIYPAQDIIGTLSEPVDYGFSSGLVPVSDPESDPEISKYGYINKKNEMIIEPQYWDVKLFNKEYSIVVIHGENEFSYPKGIIDKTGKWIIKPVYDKINLQYINDEAWITVTKEGSTAVLNSNGKPIIDFKYISIGPFSEGLASVVESKDGFTNHKYMCGYIDMKGDIVLKPQFFDPGVFINGLVVCAQYDKENYSFKYGYINKKGEFVIKPQYDYAHDFDGNGIAKVQFGNNKYQPDWFGYINTRGEYIWREE